MLRKCKSRKGITLIALVITIVVLIILAGVSISFIIQENGIITKAQGASEEQEIEKIKEQIQLEIAEKEVEKLQNTNYLTQAELEEILGKYGTVSKNDNDTIKSLILTDKNYEIPFEEIYNVELEKTMLPANGSYSETKKVNTPKINETEGMKLVTFDTATKTWKPDTTNSDYEYIAGTGTTDNTASKWANATVTKDGIESYFVWIPRYAYKITYYTNAKKTTVSSSKTSYGNIDVKFIKGTGTIAVDGTVCKYADDTTLTADDYIVHPSFTSNADLGGGFGELEGLWIGKYEASRSDADATTVGESIKLKVVPSVKSWGNITIGEMYTYAKEYNTNLNSHMLKNSEWGAVAYLTYSQYGRNGNEIAVNQCSSYITGAGPGTGTSNIFNNTYAYDESNFETTYSYTSEQGKKASTTGNEYGIYDISGGTWEYVASYNNGYSSSLLKYGSIFASNGGKSTEYETAYLDEASKTNYIKGDATSETLRWNSDDVGFGNSIYPYFFARGYKSSGKDSAGPFSFSIINGMGGEGYSFRTCLVVK